GEVERAVATALECGYRHIDCAAIYGNEGAVGRALSECVRAGGGRREELFVTSKLWNTEHSRDRVEPACRSSLEQLGLDYLDLYLIHWPYAFRSGGDPIPKDEHGNVLYADTPFTETWQAMERLVDLGLVRAIGLSNFNMQQIEEIL